MLPANPDAIGVKVPDLPAPTNQQNPANNDRTYTGPDGNIDMLFFIDRHVYRTQIGLVGLLGIAKSAIREPQRTAYYKQDCHNFQCIHLVFSSKQHPNFSCGKSIR
jgi:hypothetical protein